MSENKYGIKETLEFAAFLNAVVTATVAAKKQGVKFTLAGILVTVPLYLPAIGLSQAAFADANLIPKEFGDLDAEEAKTIINTVNSGFSLEDQLTEQEIENLFAATLNFYVAIKALFQK